jgi:putative acetyltransferase
MMTIRPEMDSDIALIYEINLLAFRQRPEADLVNELRKNRKLIVSLVTEREGRIVGHIAFSRVSADNAPEVFIAGLAPMAVLPELQGKGIGSMLVREGIEACRKMKVEGIVVLGHPDFYLRFGFQPASRFGFRCVYDAPDEAFMALELQDDMLSRSAGLIRYAPEFGAVE